MRNENEALLSNQTWNLKIIYSWQPKERYTKSKLKVMTLRILKDWAQIKVAIKVFLRWLGL